MEQFETLLRSLTKRVCLELEGYKIVKRPVWTVVRPPGGVPHSALDTERPDFSEVHTRIGLVLLGLPEYSAVAMEIENDPIFKEGVVIDAGGFLRQPERINLTRTLITNFLWRYMRQGNNIDWDDERFNNTFDELKEALLKKSIVLHTIIPLSNLKIDIAAFEFSDELKLLPASTEELERWLNRDHSLPPLGAGTPEWNSLNVDKPAVLHIQQLVEGRLPSTNSILESNQAPQVDTKRAITALRLVFNAPISVIFRETDNEGLMALGGRSMVWGWSPTFFHPLAVLTQDNANHLKYIWQLLQTSINVDILVLSLHRWESSLFRTNLEDKLIDAWVSLESILLGGQEGELSYRAAVRLAELLGKSGPERKVIYKDIKISYNWRSVVVHGIHRNNKRVKELIRRQSLKETVHRTSEYVRQLLLKVLEMQVSFNPDNIELDLLGRDTEAL